MRLNTDYLNRFIDLGISSDDLKDGLDSIGIEVKEILQSEAGVVFDIEVHSNRPDWLSHFGVARELFAKLNTAPLSHYCSNNIKLSEKGGGFAVNIEDPRDCSRYSACIVSEFRVSDSPEPVIKLLDSFGLRSINNIVDISNIVLMTMGHPIHIFDLDKLQGNEINVRRARPGEKLMLLDGQLVSLDREALVIADTVKPLALAGIMGGLDSGVTSETRNILIESACFDPILVRKTAKKLGLSTDASYRFERGADVQATEDAIRFALTKMSILADFSGNIDFYTDPYPMVYKPVSVSLPKDYPSNYTGISIAVETAEEIMSRLGFSIEDTGESWSVKVPSHRIDISCKQDLVEEIIRLYGYDKLASLLPSTQNSLIELDKSREAYRRIREYLTANGFSEAVNYNFQRPTDNLLFSQQDGSVELKNPIGLDYSMMRNSLVPGLLKNSALNYNQSVKRATFFEFGMRFAARHNKLVESETLSITASGQYAGPNWQKGSAVDYDFFLFKSQLTALFRRLSLRLDLSVVVHPFFKGHCSFDLLVNGQTGGVIGEISDKILREYKIDSPVYAVEIQMDGILKGMSDHHFVMWSKYPSSSRDFSFLMAATLDYRDLESAIKKFQPPLLDRFDLIDLYEGKHIPSGNKGYLMSFSYRIPDRTLTNEEVNEIHNELINSLISELKLKQR